MVINLHSVVRFHNAITVCDQIAKQIQLARESFDIDCEALNDYDSAILSVLLCWIRQAKRLGVRCRFVNVPQRLTEMAQVYGLTPLLPIV